MLMFVLACTCKLWIKYNPVSILHKFIAGCYRPVRVADGPITARCRFIKNASWEKGFFICNLELHQSFARVKRVWAPPPPKHTHTHTPNPPPPPQPHSSLPTDRMFVCCSYSLCVHQWIHLWCLFFVDCSPSLLLVPRKGYTSWLWHFLGIFSYIYFHI